ncbi:MAG: hypothetical protein H2038_06925 [Brevundimonas sp.]|jgi:hypothetical protein|uniref:hypothetical protein n=1 Tax=Brevundimonas sp. TaxID=1871086 RepID=UPI0018543F35|nr:hypothetical protein [Brevundimonas sp.]MBA4804365.1 hypothetical protein [Brevundimonas sp.]
MDMEAQIVAALRTELGRQAEGDGRLTLTPGESGRVAVAGELDLEALAMAVAGSVAGGP